MIRINGHEVKLETFGDGTLKCSSIDPSWLARNHLGCSVSQDTAMITWAYDNDAELFAVCCIAKELHESVDNVYLKLPYIPHARQDRKVSGRLFTLKVFAEIINSLNFKRVFVLDPHSDVSKALINNIREIDLRDFFNGLGDESVTYDAIMFPDTGAAKKYECFNTKNLPVIIGNKHRNADGRIESYDLLGFPEGVKSVRIVDDICSYGGTFVAAAKALRERGVEKITLVVSHCENNILKGDVFKYIDRVFTTDSICTIEHPQLMVNKYFRGGFYV